MSDSDDWEKIAEKDDSALEAIINTGKFKDEITVLPVEEVKQPVNPPKAKKVLGENLNKRKKNNAEAVKEEATEDKSKRIAEGKLKEELADNQITDELFDVKPITILSSDDNYIEYAREVGRSLYKGQYHFRLPVFYKELFKETSSLMSADDMNKVITQLTIIHTQKVKDQKGPGKKSTNTKPALKNDPKKGKALGNDEDPGGDDYDDYEDFL